MYGEKKSKDKLKFLHQMLDEQIKGVKSTIDHERSQMEGFAAIEKKLKDLEIKLQTIQHEHCVKHHQKGHNETSEKKLKQHSISKTKFAIDQQHTPLKRRRASLTENHRIVDKLGEKHIINRAQEKYSPRTYEIGTSLKKVKINSAKKSKSTKKLSYTLTSKSTKTLRPSLSTLKKQKKQSERKEELANQLESYKKKNQQLKVKVNELKVYEKEFLKIKDLFDKSQKLRKKKNKHLY